MKIFSFSLYLSLNVISNCDMTNANKLLSLVLDEPLIPVDHLIQLFNTQEEAVAKVDSVVKLESPMKDDQHAGNTGDISRKRVLTPTLPRQDSLKKAKQDSPPKESNTGEANSPEAVAGSDQPHCQL